MLAISDSFQARKAYPEESTRFSVRQEPRPVPTKVSRSPLPDRAPARRDQSHRARTPTRPRQHVRRRKHAPRAIGSNSAGAPTLRAASTSTTPRTPHTKSPVIPATTTGSAVVARTAGVRYDMAPDAVHGGPVPFFGVHVIGNRIGARGKRSCA
jgi:hypothetical protein